MLYNLLLENHTMYLATDYFTDSQQNWCIVLMPILTSTCMYDCILRYCYYVTFLCTMRPVI